LDFQNREIASLVKPSYTADELSALREVLRRHGTLDFVRLPTGLFPASSAGESVEASGYGHVWVRDNVYVAYAHYVVGQTDIAAGVARALLEFFDRHRRRFEDIISGAVDPQTIAARPHVRFDGKGLSEIAERWPHAQNDALGYFLWLYAEMALHGALEPTERELSMLALFPHFFKAIEFWQDQDSGHWEEVRKISASSIGTVVAGLESLRRLLDVRASDPDLIPLTADLAERGRQALAEILPNECVQISPSRNRRYDAALIFLLYPLGVVDGPMADLLLHDAAQYLTGRIGIRRYLLDSYYAPDFDRDYPAEKRTADHSGGTESRDMLINDVGEEAQWCMFDPILSAYYGSRYGATRSAADLERQVHHFNRALAQITDLWQCPELYYLQTIEPGGKELRPNTHVPLLWTQANLLLALEAMRLTANLSP
jgi:GH15 family glucan-1,4-alpha-glucosidase